MGIVTLVVRPDEQIERVVAGSVAHGALMTLKKRTSGVSPETWKNGLTRRRNYLAEEGKACRYASGGIAGQFLKERD
jgi:hypothetical protein